MIANNTAFDQSVHLTPADVAVDSHTNPTMLQVHLKSSKSYRQCIGVTVTVGKTDDELCPCQCCTGLFGQTRCITGSIVHNKRRTPIDKVKICSTIQRSAHPDRY